MPLFLIQSPLGSAKEESWVNAAMTTQAVQCPKSCHYTNTLNLLSEFYTLQRQKLFC